MDASLVATGLEKDIHAGFSLFSQVNFEHLLCTQGIQGSVSLVHHAAFLVEFLTSNPVSSLLQNLPFDQVQLNVGRSVFNTLVNEGQRLVNISDK